jgi:hypothetical protein
MGRHWRADAYRGTVGATMQCGGAYSLQMNDSLATFANLTFNWLPLQPLTHTLKKMVMALDLHVELAKSKSWRQSCRQEIRCDFQWGWGF